MVIPTLGNTICIIIIVNNIDSYKNSVLKLNNKYLIINFTSLFTLQFQHKIFILQK